MSKNYQEELQQMVDLVLKTGHEDNQLYFLQKKEEIIERVAGELADLELVHHKARLKLTEELAVVSQRQSQREALDTAQRVIAKKQGYLSQLFDEARGNIQAWSPEAFSQMVQPIFNDNSLTGVVTVTLGSYSQGFLADKQLSDFASEHGNIEYKLSAELIADEGGFVLSQGGIEYNFLYSSLLEEVNEKSERRIAKFLFEEVGQ
ncbi:hypothetical protein [uncultured Vagococcus sp.]|uniref:hypothetical protein n=1 Tax=uncultured Vagococcus sp. TaxID=189676 RepID=UPI0028D573D1|nr:hypothetical protein [uncultured Vagococcus sp.]